MFGESVSSGFADEPTPPPLPLPPPADVCAESSGAALDEPYTAVVGEDAPPVSDVVHVEDVLDTGVMDAIAPVDAMKESAGVLFADVAGVLGEDAAPGAYSPADEAYEFGEAAEPAFGPAVLGAYPAAEDGAGVAAALFGDEPAYSAADVSPGDVFAGYAPPVGDVACDVAEVALVEEPPP